MYIELEKVKSHLNIDASFKDDDDYLSGLIEVAEDAISKHLDQNLEEVMVDGKLPSAILHSILLMVGNLYANREPVAYTSVTKVPFTLDYLLGLYKHYYLP